jgi:hypothetical protein
MAVSRAMRRLLRVRGLEEEQCRRELETANGVLNHLETALVATAERSLQGRKLVQDSVRRGELQDRLAGLEETRIADRCATALQPMIAAQKENVEQLRENFLMKRVERRQAETLIEECEAAEAVIVDRKGQQELDNWYNVRRYRQEQEAEQEHADASQTNSDSTVGEETSA